MNESNNFALSNKMLSDKNEMKNSQLSVMVIILPLVFKMAMLPSLMFQEAGSASYIAIGIMATMEFLILMTLINISKLGGMEAIVEKFGIGTARLIISPLLIVFVVKIFIYLVEISLYVSNAFFYNISNSIINVVLIVTICYVATKGARSIARFFSLTIWLIPIIFFVGILYGKTNMELTYAIPFFDKTPLDMLGGVNKYMIYTFDFSALIFAKMRGKNNKALVASGILHIFIVMSFYVIFIATYGYSAHLIPNAFGRLSSFNTVVSEIGSLDISSSTLWIFTAIINLALKFYGIGEIASYFKINSKFAIYFAGLGVFITFLATKATFLKTSNFFSGWIRYVIISIEILTPVITLILLNIKKNQRINNSKKLEVSNEKT